MRPRLQVLVVLGVSLLLSRQVSGQTDTIRAAVRVTREAGDIPRKDLEAVARRVSSLCVEPSSVEVHIGDTLDLATMYVVAYDSTGVSLGRLPVFDSELHKTAHVVPTGIRRYVAMSEGRADFSFRYPRRAWLGRQDPPVEVRFHINVVRK